MSRVTFALTTGILALTELLLLLVAIVLVQKVTAGSDTLGVIGLVVVGIVVTAGTLGGWVIWGRFQNIVDER